MPQWTIEFGKVAHRIWKSLSQKLWYLVNVCGVLYTRASAEESNGSTAAMEIEPLASDFQVSLSTSLLVLAIYTATLHVSVPGGDSGIYLLSLIAFHF